MPDIQIPIPRSPILGPDGKTLDRTWYLFFYDLWQRSGGTQTVSLDDADIEFGTADATDDGLDVRPQTADLERAVTFVDESPSTVAADVAELQALIASLVEDPVLVRFTAQRDGLVPASGGGTVNFARADGSFASPLSPVSKQTVTGSRGGNAALASLLTALATYGLIIDSTTA